MSRPALLPAAEQVEEVRKELKKRNSGFDGTLKPTLENDAVIGLTFSTDRSPVRALTRMQHLEINGSNLDLGSLVDLSPLKGMSLVFLELNDNKVSDLTPILGMPLNELDIESSTVTDLSPLKDLPLKILRCDFQSARDAKILRGIKSLKKINEKEAIEIWKELDGK